MRLTFDLHMKNRKNRYSCGVSFIRKQMDERLSFTILASTDIQCLNPFIHLDLQNVNIGFYFCRFI